MKISYLPVALAAIGFLQYAAASPIRVVIVSSHGDVSTNVQVGNADSLVAKIIRPQSQSPNFVSVNTVSTQESKPKHLCNKVKDKAIDISNKFREAFGLPLIEKTPEIFFHPAPPVRLPHEEVKILPFIGTPVHHVHSEAWPVVQPTPVLRTEVFPSQPSHTGGMRHRGGCHKSFVHRVHRALTILGPWEGRAVAFVLGCGIGVLLRMFWVMAIVVARSFRGRNNSEDDDVQHILIFERDAEEILVPPPQYTDEKVALAVADSDKKADVSA